MNIGVLEEARYYGIDGIVGELETMVESSNVSRDEKPLTRRDVIDVLIGTSHSKDHELRFQVSNKVWCTCILKCR